MEIIDREDERRQLFRSDERFILLSAPTHYGKSHLLQNAEAELGDGWKVARVDLRPSRSEYRPLSSQEELLEAIWGQFAKAQPYPKGMFGRAIGRLIQIAADIDKPLLFVLDGAEIVSDGDTVRWLQGEIIHPISDRRNANNRYTRFIISGQAFSTNWIETNRALTNRPGFSKATTLGPFNHSHITVALNGRVEETKKQEQDAWAPPDVNQLALKVIQFSAGHPAVVDHMLAQLDKSVYRPENSEEFYRTVFERYTIPEWNLTLGHLNEILAKLHPRAAECFKHLSVFRQCDIEIVKIVWTHTITPEARTFAGDDLYDDFVTCLQQNDLALADKDTGFYSNNIYRTILERQLQMHENVKWLALHYLALRCFYQELYHGESDKRSSNRFVRHALLTREIFYHGSVIHTQLGSRNGLKSLQRQLLADLGILAGHHRASIPPARWDSVVSEDVLVPIENDGDIKGVFIQWGKGEEDLKGLLERVRTEFCAPEV